ncbi:12929_t:CDS:2 [Entrophospora sp. SA101]|nr:15427_t:CDS:2 [Entrophospora sp. SA101]CAJ0747025.1 12929_t:CDS:2 [Entrophospora sp. SA101]CAJ0894318.1 13366_t:CDS:2 [Entrophospora sp. SA101]
MLETGQPLHIYDYDKLPSKEIIIRQALEKEKITILSGKTLSLSPEDIVISTSQEAISLAGISGSQTGAVNDQTANILIESACFAPYVIKKTSQRLAISTKTSQYFSKKYNLPFGNYALVRAIELIKEICQGEKEQIIRWTKETNQPSEKTITISQAFIEKKLGVKLEAKKLEAILNHHRETNDDGRRTFSNFYRSPITVRIPSNLVDKVRQITELLNNEDPRYAKNFPQGRRTRTDWEDRDHPERGYNLRAMRFVLRAKFTQNPELKRFLLATGSADLIENTKIADPQNQDWFWGNSNFRDGDESYHYRFYHDCDTNKCAGRNWLGQILTEIREELNVGERQADLTSYLVNEDLIRDYLTHLQRSGINTNYSESDEKYAGDQYSIRDPQLKAVFKNLFNNAGHDQFKDNDETTSGGETIQFRLQFQGDYIFERGRKKRHGFFKYPSFTSHPTTVKDYRNRSGSVFAYIQDDGSFRDEHGKPIEDTREVPEEVNNNITFTIESVETPIARRPFDPNDPNNAEYLEQTSKKKIKKNNQIINLGLSRCLFARDEEIQNIKIDLRALTDDQKRLLEVGNNITIEKVAEEVRIVDGNLELGLNFDELRAASEEEIRNLANTIDKVAIIAEIDELINDLITAGDKAQVEDIKARLHNSLRMLLTNKLEALRERGNLDLVDLDVTD